MMLRAVGAEVAEVPGLGAVARPLRAAVLGKVHGPGRSRNTVIAWRPPRPWLPQQPSVRALIWPTFTSLDSRSSQNSDTITNRVGRRSAVSNWWRFRTWYSKTPA
jgi:hypothetical protein